MRTLHVACMPFPSPQGTQAVIRNMLDALAATDDAHLLTYDTSFGPPSTGSWTHHRVKSGLPGVSARSGPSMNKVVRDVAMVLALRRLAARLKPDFVIGHNVEASWVAQASGCRAVYFAHTRFDTELPTYFAKPQDVAESSGLRQELLRGLGGALDSIACNLPVLAVSPSLAKHLRAHYMPVPWPAIRIVSRLKRGDETSGGASEIAAPSYKPITMTRQSTSVARRTVAYVGNLDGYQGWEDVVTAVSMLRDVNLWVGTASDTRQLKERARSAAVALHVGPLATEDDRRRIYDQCDLAVVPRRAEGGLPMKLLDGLARGVPVVAQRRAAAGLEPDGVTLVPNHAAGLADGIRALLEAPESLAARGEAGRQWLIRHHSPEVFRRSLHACLATGHFAHRMHPA